MSAPTDEVVVLGAGIAGAAAAAVLAGAARRVRVVHAAAGASMLWNGIVDVRGGEASPEERELLGAFGIVAPRPRPRLVTSLGTSREAFAHDAELLDLEAARPKLVLVPSLARPGWDGRAVAAMLADAHAGQFEARSVSVPGLLEVDELAMADGAIAQRLDDEKRAEAFVAVLEAALERWRSTSTALLMPPWLGVARPLAKRLAASLALQVGECTTTLAGAAGLRFRARRDALFARLRIEVTRARVVAVEVVAGGVKVHLEGGDRIDGAAIVCATGGLVSGAIAIPRAAAAAEPAIEGRSVPSLDFDAPFLRVGARGRAIYADGSRYGTTPDDLHHGARARGIIDALGVLASADGCVREGLPVRVAGDLVADGEKTFGAALRAGIRAAKSLLRSG